VNADKYTEIGCGKGYFIELARERGFEITGFDSAYEGDDPTVRKENLHPGMRVEGDGIILRHVLEHVQDPLSFIRNIARSCSGKALIYIEVPCLDWILENNAWFDIFYEHVNYFRLSDFDRMFEKVIASGRFFGGQYLYVVAEISSVIARKNLMPVGDVVFPGGFMTGIASICDYIAESSAPVVVWGAASKGVIFSLYMKRFGVDIDGIVDINPAKQGKYIAGTGVKVMTPERLVEKFSSETEVLVMNSQYLREIVDNTDNKFKYKVVEANDF